jgi:hypothetical protein
VLIKGTSAPIIHTAEESKPKIVSWQRIKIGNNKLRYFFQRYQMGNMRSEAKDQNRLKYHKKNQIEF